ncbi:phosphotransferase enzyme family protein [Acetobacter persici]|uniref:phosphotransferase enzyme family protein n=1 Tax=Acetobacter persici TaxID=1076596 RepID=UPI0039EACEE7
MSGPPFRLLSDQPSGASSAQLPAVVSGGAGHSGAPGQFGVHGVQEKRDWPPLTEAEVASVLAHYPALPPVAAILWHSMRPFSAAGIVQMQGALPKTVVVKRHHAQLRSVAALEAEHAFMRHLGARGLPVSTVLRTGGAGNGASALTQGQWTYEVFLPAQGEDLYRETMSWQPYQSLDHARVAGAELARLHKAAEGFEAPARGEACPLVSSMVAVGQEDFLPALRAWGVRQPGLAQQLAGRAWEQDVQAALGPFHAVLLPLLGAVKPCWGHGDWHGSNLLWAPGPAAGICSVLDFGMADRTCAVFDLAVALERSGVMWLDLSGPDVVVYPQIQALLEGYQNVRPLSAAERALLVAFLPLVHVEFALSEVAYFGTLLKDPASAEVAYTEYLLGHARWFAGDEGRALLDWLPAALARGAAAVS